MPRWFPRADGRRGLNKALIAGSVGVVAVLAMDAYGVVDRLRRFEEYRAYGVSELASYLLIFRICLAVVDLTAAWRFAVGKGLVWGSVLLLLVVLPVVSDFVMGRTSANLGWIIVRIAVAVALIIGIRGAWLVRTIPPPPPDYAEVFE